MGEQRLKRFGRGGQRQRRFRNLGRINDVGMGLRGRNDLVQLLGRLVRILGRNDGHRISRHVHVDGGVQQLARPLLAEVQQHHAHGRP